MWAIYSKQDNVWIKWVNSVYLKGASWWDYKPQTGASWYWRRIYHVKEAMKGIYTEAKLSTSSAYSIQEVYNRFKGDKEKVIWESAIWNRLTVPKYRFISWLAI